MIEKLKIDTSKKQLHFSTEKMQDIMSQKCLKKYKSTISQVGEGRITFVGKKQTGTGKLETGKKNERGA